MEDIKNNLNKEDQPYYSKYYVKDFEEEIKKNKFSFAIPQDYEEGKLYFDLVES